MQFPPFPTVGAEARSGFILLSTLAAMGWERPWGRGRERWEGLPQESWQEFPLLCSSGLNWAGGKVNFSGTLSYLFGSFSRKGPLCILSSPSKMLPPTGLKGHCPQSSGTGSW